MKIKELLIEGISSTLFHFTSLPALWEILKNDEFQLSTDTHSYEQRNQRIKDRAFYMSFSRHRLGGFHVNKKRGALITVDGSKLGQRYSGKPINFHSDYKENPEEAEDRIYSDDSTIKNASSYIKNIEFLVSKDSDRQLLEKIINKLESLGITYKIYNNRRAFLSKGKAGENIAGNKSEKLPDSSSDFWEPYIELISKNSSNGLSPEAYDVLETIVIYGREDKASDDLKRKVLDNRTNPKSNKIISTIFKKMKVGTLEEFVGKLKEKWHPILKTERS